MLEIPKSPVDADSKEVTLHVAGIDAQATYIAVAVVSNEGSRAEAEADSQ
jgi:hypothetical protein